jgi:hypothetical protein
VSVVENVASGPSTPSVAPGRDLVEGSMLREVAQSCYLIALMAASLSLFLGLGLLAMWLLG